VWINEDHQNMQKMEPKPSKTLIPSDSIHPTRQSSSGWGDSTKTFSGVALLSSGVKRITLLSLLGGTANTQIAGIYQGSNMFNPQIIPIWHNTSMAYLDIIGIDPSPFQCLVT
jgi:hypothetical protein